MGEKPTEQTTNDRRYMSEATREALEEMGFASLEEFWAEMRRREERDNPWLRKRRARETGLPRGEAPARTRPGTRSCQVNVKLTPEDHEALSEAAREYGVAVATMAQLLVNRGLEAVGRERQDPALTDAATSGR